jgi:uncharacterized membrane protein
MDELQKEFNKTMERLKKNLAKGKITPEQFEEKKINKTIKLYGRY